MVVVGEDCALTSHDKTAGRRGLAGTIFVHKVNISMKNICLASVKPRSDWRAVSLK